MASGIHLVLKGLNDSAPGKNAGEIIELSSAKISY